MMPLKALLAKPWKLIIFLVGIYVISVVSYEPTHLQDIFCKSEFVILARVLKEVVDKCKCSYTIEVVEQFKKSCKSEDALEKQIMIGAKASNGTSCNEMKMGHDFILAGYIKHGLPHIDPALIPIEGSDVTEFQEDALRGIYAYNCRCQVLVSPLKKMPRNGLKFCLWRTYNEVIHKDDCQMRFSACTYDRKKKNCIWRNDEAFFKCNRNKRLLQAHSILSFIKRLQPYHIKKFFGGRKEIPNPENAHNIITEDVLQIHSEFPERIITDTENDNTGPTGSEWKY